MNRREFTRNLAKLIDFMTDNGDEPVIDYVLRSAEEQKKLFDKGLSKCDGTIIKSNHQRGLAADIYLVFNDEVDYFWIDKTKLNLYHYKWEELGGNKMISWDAPHFEG